MDRENVARSLVDLVAYQEASVVSKTLLELSIHLTSMPPAPHNGG